MPARHATALKSVGYRTKGRKDRSSGKRDHLAPQAGTRPAAVPDTAMASAFLNALVRLFGAHHSKIEVTLPTGIANIGEIELVLRGLGLIDRPAS